LESAEKATASVLPRQHAQLALPLPATPVNDFHFLISLPCLTLILSQFYFVYS
jgi:hypothetical protein